MASVDTPVMCASDLHDEPEPATVAGTFDCSHVNGRPPSRFHYCTRCAVVLEMGGMFTPDRVLTVTPPLEELRGPEWARLAREAAPRTTAALDAHNAHAADTTPVGPPSSGSTK